MAARPDLEALIRAARRGDRAAAGELWLCLRRLVATILLAHADRRELDDLMQEVALRLYRSLRDLDDPARLRPWLCAIARNVAIDHGRRAAALPPPGAPAPHRPNGDAPADEPWFDGAARERGRDDLEQTLRDLGALEPIYREALLLRALDGLSQREIAELLGVPETTVETRLARARRWLRDRRDALDGRNDRRPGDRHHAPL
ncbi:MAG: sigma-70 family RNA polymerase sigma factor [Planctomycetota bacterium]